MIDDSATKNTNLLDREFIPKTEHLDLQSLVQQICDSHKFDYTSIIICYPYSVGRLLLHFTVSYPVTVSHLIISCIHAILLQMHNFYGAGAL